MKWTDEKRREARRLYEQDERTTWADVAVHFDRSPSNVRKQVARLDVDKGPSDQTPHRILPTYEDWQQPENVDWRDWFASWGRVNEMHKLIDPHQDKLTVDMSLTDEPVAVAFAADLHMGGGYTDHEAIRQTMEYVMSTPNLLVAFVGDGIEGFIPGDKSAETIEQMPSGLKAQIAAYRSLVEELVDAGKLLFMTWGDHDAKWFEKAIGLNVVKHQMHSKVPYFNGRAVVTLKLGDEEYYVQVNHAERFNSQWNRNHPQRRQYERFFPADVNVSGHKHKPAFQMTTHYEQLREHGLNVGGKHWLIATGTFKTGPDPYTVRKWTKGVIGVPTVVFHPDNHDTDCFDAPHKAVRYIQGESGDEA